MSKIAYAGLTNQSVYLWFILESISQFWANDDWWSSLNHYITDSTNMSRVRISSWWHWLENAQRSFNQTESAENIRWRQLTEPQDDLINIKGVLHITINQPWRIHKCHQAEPLLPRRADLGAQVLWNSWKLIEDTQRLQGKPSNTRKQARKDFNPGWLRWWRSYL